MLHIKDVQTSLLTAIIAGVDNWEYFDRSFDIARVLISPLTSFLRWINLSSVSMSIVCDFPLFIWLVTLDISFRALLVDRFGNTAKSNKSFTDLATWNCLENIVSFSFDCFFLPFLPSVVWSVVWTSAVLDFCSFSRTVWTFKNLASLSYKINLYSFMPKDCKPNVKLYM